MLDKLYKAQTLALARCKLAEAQIDTCIAEIAVGSGAIGQREIDIAYWRGCRAEATRTFELIESLVFSAKDAAK